MAGNGEQIFNIGNHCEKAHIKVKHHNATITTNGNQVIVPVNMNIGNNSGELAADVEVNLPGGDHQQQQEQGQQVPGVARQCSEETEARQAVSETSDNDDKYISCQRKPTSSYHERSPKKTV